MSYIDKNLMNSEKVIYKAKMHWSIFIPSILLFSIGLLLMIISNNILGIGFILLAIVAFVRAIIIKKSTELGVTSKRVIAKFGLIKRNTIELNHSKVESYNVDQSVLGRIFDFGTIIINGTGGGRTPIPNIDKPLEFRKYAMETIDNS